SGKSIRLAAGLGREREVKARTEAVKRGFALRPSPQLLPCNDDKRQLLWRSSVKTVVSCPRSSGAGALIPSQNIDGGH
ncbi:hypothetical protein JOQ06_028508, partial [Pogonophryne albipinna]